MSRCYSHLTLADRRRLYQLVERKVPINEMARQLGGHRSTIYREKRNTFKDRPLPDYDGYLPTISALQMLSNCVRGLFETYRQGRHEIVFHNDKCAPPSGTQPHVNPSPDALETDMSCDIKLQDLTDGESVSAFDASRMTAEAIQMFGENAPTAVACCGLDAWIEGDEKQVEFWGQVLNRLTT